jgi:hypothetical protein
LSGAPAVGAINQKRPRWQVGQSKLRRNTFLARLCRDSGGAHRRRASAVGIVLLNINSTATTR